MFVINGLFIDDTRENHIVYGGLFNMVNIALTQMRDIPRTVEDCAEQVISINPEVLFISNILDKKAEYRGEEVIKRLKSKGFKNMIVLLTTTLEHSKTLHITGNVLTIDKVDIPNQYIEVSKVLKRYVLNQ